MSDALFIRLTHFTIREDQIEDPWIRADVVLNDEVICSAETRRREDSLENYQISRGTVISMVKSKFIMNHVNDVRREGG